MNSISPRRKNTSCCVMLVPSGAHGVFVSFFFYEVVDSLGILIFKTQASPLLQSRRSMSLSKDISSL